MLVFSFIVFFLQMYSIFPDNKNREMYTIFPDGGSIYYKLYYKLYITQIIHAIKKSSEIEKIHRKHIPLYKIINKCEST